MTWQPERSRWMVSNGRWRFQHRRTAVIQAAAMPVLVTLRLGGMLLAVSALSFIGLGAQPPEPEWGALLSEGREYLEQAWWLTFSPSCAIALTVFGLNQFGDSLRDRLDPAR